MKYIYVESRNDGFVSTAWLIFFVSFVARGIEAFYLGSDSICVISFVVGLTGTLFFARYYSIKPKGLGVDWSSVKIFSALLIAVIVFVMSVGGSIALESLITRRTNAVSDLIDYPNCVFFLMRDYSLAYGGRLTFLKWSAVGFAEAFLRVLFSELYFRGYLYVVYNGHLRFLRYNIVQALLFSAFFTVLTGVSGFSLLSFETAVVYILLTFLYQFLIGLRLGVMRRISDTIWLPALSYMLERLFRSFFHIYPYTKIAYENFLRTILIDLLALAVTLVIFAVYKTREYRRL